MAEPCVVGLDVGGTKIERVAYRRRDGRWEEDHRDRVPTPAHSLDAFVSTVVALVRASEARLGSGLPVGVGLPGVQEAGTGLQRCSNLPGLHGQPVAQRLSEALGRPIAVGNDLQCFALSEAQGGAADGLPSVFGLILGTGAGGGLCLDGRLVRGFNHMAGEWGHWPLPAALREQHQLPLWSCPCGLTGCLERYVSGTGLQALHRHLGGAAEDAARIVQLGADGDARAQQALAIHLDVLAQGLASMMMLWDPHAIVIGGGLSKLPHLYAQLPGAIGRHLFAGLRVPPILPARFGDAGGARGAALWAWAQAGQGSA